MNRIHNGNQICVCPFHIDFPLTADRAETEESGGLLIQHRFSPVEKIRGVGLWVTHVFGFLSALLSV